MENISLQEARAIWQAASLLRLLADNPLFAEDLDFDLIEDMERRACVTPYDLTLPVRCGTDL
jgi:hypothetical protein